MTFISAVVNVTARFMNATLCGAVRSGVQKHRVLFTTALIKISKLHYIKINIRQNTAGEMTSWPVEGFCWLHALSGTLGTMVFVHIVYIWQENAILHLTYVDSK